MKRKFISCALLILSVSLIFGLTLQGPKGTADLTNSARQAVISSAENAGMSREETVAKWWADTDFLRKAAHIPEYFILGAASCYAFKCLAQKRRLVKAMAFCAVISFSDQLLKGLLPYREFDITDVPLDLLGSAMGIFALLSVTNICKYVAKCVGDSKTEETK